MSMIERVARAIAEADDEDYDALPNLYNAQAVAALEAMREPTSAQLDRFVSRALCVSISGEGGWSAYGRNQWQAMIDAAIAE